MTVSQVNDQRMADRIVELVCDDYKVTLDELRAPSRRQKFTKPRHVAIYLMRCLTRLNLSDIGAHFHRDHSCADNSIRHLERRCRKDSSFNASVRRIKLEARNAYRPNPVPETCSACGHVLH